MFTQLTVSNELSITQIPFGLFLFSENVLSFLSKMHFSFNFVYISFNINLLLLPPPLLLLLLLLLQYPACCLYFDHKFILLLHSYVLI